MLQVHLAAKNEHMDASCSNFACRSKISLAYLVSKREMDRMHNSRSKKQGHLRPPPPFRNISQMFLFLGSYPFLLLLSTITSPCFSPSTVRQIVLIFKALWLVIFLIPKSQAKSANNLYYGKCISVCY